MDLDLIKYVPGIAKLVYQGIICNILTKRKFCDSTL